MSAAHRTGAIPTDIRRTERLAAGLVIIACVATFVVPIPARGAIQVTCFGLVALLALFGAMRFRLRTQAVAMAAYFLLIGALLGVSGLGLTVPSDVSTMLSVLALVAVLVPHFVKPTPGQEQL